MDMDGINSTPEDHVSDNLMSLSSISPIKNTSLFQTMVESEIDLCCTNIEDITFSSIPKLRFPPKKYRLDKIEGNSRTLNTIDEDKELIIDQGTIECKRTYIDDTILNDANDMEETCKVEKSFSGLNDEDEEKIIDNYFNLTREIGLDDSISDMEETCINMEETCKFNVNFGPLETINSSSNIPLKNLKQKHEILELPCKKKEKKPFLEFKDISKNPSFEFETVANDQKGVNNIKIECWQSIDNSPDMHKTIKLINDDDKCDLCKIKNSIHSDSLSTTVLDYSYDTTQSDISEVLNSTYELTENHVQKQPIEISNIQENTSINEQNIDLNKKLTNEDNKDFKIEKVIHNYSLDPTVLDYSYDITQYDITEVLNTTYDLIEDDVQKEPIDISNIQENTSINEQKISSNFEDLNLHKKLINEGKIDNVIHNYSLDTTVLDYSYDLTTKYDITRIEDTIYEYKNEGKTHIHEVLIESENSAKNICFIDENSKQIEECTVLTNKQKAVSIHKDQRTENTSKTEYLLKSTNENKDLKITSYDGKSKKVLFNMDLKLKAYILMNMVPSHVRESFMDFKMAQINITVFPKVKSFNITMDKIDYTSKLIKLYDTTKSNNCTSLILYDPEINKRPTVVLKGVDNNKLYTFLKKMKDREKRKIENTNKEMTVSKKRKFWTLPVNSKITRRNNDEKQREVQKEGYFKRNWNAVREAVMRRFN